MKKSIPHPQDQDGKEVSSHGMQNCTADPWGTYFFQTADAAACLTAGTPADGRLYKAFGGFYYMLRTAGTISHKSIRPHVSRVYVPGEKIFSNTKESECVTK